MVADEGRLLDLLDEYVDGRSSAAGLAELESLLGSSAAARRIYWEYLQQHAMIGQLQQERAGEKLAAETATAGSYWSLWGLAAAAALLLAAGALALVPGPGKPAAVSEAGGSVLVLANGTRVLQRPGSRVSLGASEDEDDVEQVVRLHRGEIEVHAAKSECGQSSVRVETDLGTVESLGTVFRVGLSAGEKTVRERASEGVGGKEIAQMRAGRVMPFAAALMLVSVMEGRVLVRSGLGATEVRAGETARVEKEEEEKAKAGPAVNGLQISFSRRVVIRKSVTFVEKGGKRVEVDDPDAREYRREELLAELKNVSDRTIAFKTFSKFVVPQGEVPRAPWVCATDAEGNRVPEHKRRFFRRNRGGDEKKAGKAVQFSVTVLKPGQSLSLRCYTHTLDFPKEGTYKLHMEWKLDADPDLEAAGIKLWSGKLTSNTVDWKYVAPKRRQRPARRMRDVNLKPGSAKKPPADADEAGDKKPEAF